MKGFMQATLEANHYLTGPSPRDIGGQICKGKHKSMWRNAINAKDFPQTFINQGESLILCPALGHLLNGA